MNVLVAQSCLPRCGPMDSCRPGSSVRGVLRQEYWSGLPFPSPGVLPDPGIEPGSPALQVDSLLPELPKSSFLTLNLQGLPGSPLDRFEMCSRQLGDTGNWGLTTEGQFQRGEGDSQLLRWPGRERGLLCREQPALLGFIWVNDVCSFCGDQAGAMPGVGSSGSRWSRVDWWRKSQHEESGRIPLDAQRYSFWSHGNFRDLLMSPWKVPPQPMWN